MTESDDDRQPWGESVVCDQCAFHFWDVYGKCPRCGALSPIGRTHKEAADRRGRVRSVVRRNLVSAGADAETLEAFDRANPESGDLKRKQAFDDPGPVCVTCGDPEGHYAKFARRMEAEAFRLRQERDDARNQIKTAGVVAEEAEQARIVRIVESYLIPEEYGYADLRTEAKHEAAESILRKIKGGNQ